jgi:cysteinyl-tRNA synthetase
MALKIYNSHTGKKEEFVPVVPGEVRIYVCGVTVYDDSHIGHARSTIAFDVICRYLRSLGYKVTYIRNFTDVDDKIINRANAEGRDWREIADTYIESFGSDMESLGVLPPTIEPRATDHIDEMIHMIEELVNKGFAYLLDGSVYFSVSKDRNYGALSGRSIDDMIAGARIDVDDRKANPLDFALWKESKPDEPWWDSPFGKGRPGWHIECSAMSTKYLGNPFDIHGGGKDLVFPHHENEQAQTECATGHKFVNFWVHNGFVTMDREKMSKSIGNTLSIKDFLKKYHREVLRLFFLSAHYRNPVDYAQKAIDSADSALKRLYGTLERISELLPETALHEGIPYEEIDACERRFYEAMEDDFNTAVALSAIFDLSTILNRFIDEGNAAARPAIIKGGKVLVQLANLLGLLTDNVDQFIHDETLRHLSSLGMDEHTVNDMVNARTEARKAKDFAKADEIRRDLLEKGILLLDTPGGTRWRIKK